MDKDNAFLQWLVGIAVSLISLGIGFWKWVQSELRVRDVKIDSLKDEVTSIKLSISDVDKKLELNTQADLSHYKLIMEKLTQLSDNHKKIFEKLEEYDKNISNFYQLNPDIKNPTLP